MKELPMRWPPFKLERFFGRYEFNVDYVLGASDCESMTVDGVLGLETGAGDRLLHCWLGYTESQGSPALRDEVAAIYETVGSDDVLVHSGAEEAIFLFMHAALHPGDHLIVHWPCYQSLAEVARGLGCCVTPWRAQEASGWSLDPDELQALLRPNTRAVVVNSPHNPTGYQMPREAFQAMIDRVARHGCWLFSDEVYRESEYADSDRLPAACDLYDRAVSLGVMSKTYGLPGLRIGWVASHDRLLLQRMLQLKDYTTICNAAPSEVLAEVALRHRDKLVQRTVALLRRNLALMDKFIMTHQAIFEWQRPIAGPIGFPKLRGAAAALGADVLCDQLAQEGGVLLIPGTVYDVPGHVRVGFGRANLPEALERLAMVLEQLLLD